MPLSFALPEETGTLLADIRDWSLNEARPLARIADRRQTKYFEESRRVLETCPIDIAPLSVPELGLWRNGGGTDYVATENEGSFVLGALAMEAMCYGDGWVWGALPANANLEKILKVIATPEQLERWVEPMRADPNQMSSFAFTEEGCGSDIAAIKTMAVRDGDEWVINGAKRFSSQGAEASLMLVFLTIDPSRGLQGLRGVIIPRDTPGITVIRETEDMKLGMRFLRQSTIRFDDVRVPLDHMLGWPNEAEGFLNGLEVLNRTRPYCMAWNIGTLRGAVDYVRDWARAQPNGFNPQRHRRIEEDLDQITASIDDAMRLILNAAYRADRGLPCRTEAAMAKSHIPKACDRGYRRLLQIMGSEASSEEHLVEKWYRDSITFDLVEGTSQILKITVGRAMCAEASREVGEAARRALEPTA
jgi:alkylation response protein AidB-like acyl-CoA dehydrogenase